MKYWKCSLILLAMCASVGCHRPAPPLMAWTVNNPKIPQAKYVATDGKVCAFYDAAGNKLADKCELKQIKATQTESTKEKL